MMMMMMFMLLCCSYRQAQATVLAALPKLHKLQIPTKRPEDYFAEMAKSDQHMQKVCVCILLVILACFKSAQFEITALVIV